MPYKAREDGHILIVGDARLKYLRLFNFFAKPLLSYIITEALDMKKGGKNNEKGRCVLHNQSPLKNELLIQRLKPVEFWKLR